MKSKFLILILGLSLTAASCNFGIFDFGPSGIRGVLKSEDGGESFNAANALSKKGDLSGLNTNTIHFDPNNPDIIYLASSAGLYKSTDAAGTWVYTLSGITLADVIVDPADSNVVYASGIVGTNGKIVKSLDGGTSWVDIYTEPSNTNAVLSLAISPLNRNIILGGLGNGELIRSTDAGHSWQAIVDFADRVKAVKFNPTGTAYALTARKGLQRSRDSGVSWSPITSHLTDNTISSQGLALSAVSTFMEVALDLKQPGVLYLGTQQGLYRSVDDGETWAFLKLPVKDSSLQTQAVVVDPTNSNNVMAAIGSTIFKSNNGGLTWQSKVLPTGVFVRRIIINPQSSNLIYLGMGTVN